MMTDDLLQLITAGVDGELTALESRRLSRLLNTSAEARAVHAGLLGDSKRLSALPRVAPPADLQANVMARIASLTPIPTRLAKLQPRPRTTQPVEVARPVIVPRRRKVSNWVPVAVAASLLLCVTSGSFLFFSQQNRTASARNVNRPPPGTHKGAGDPEWAKWLPAETAQRPSAPVPREQPALPETYVAKNTLPVVPASDLVALAPEPRSVRPDLLGGGFLPETRFDMVEVRVPFLKPLAAFAGEEAQEQLTKELSRDPAYRIDLFSRNPLRAVELLRDASKAAGVNLYVDGNTIAALQKRTVNATVVYTESLTAQELATLFAKLSAEDAKVSPHAFDSLHATAVSQIDVSDLRSTLGFDPGLFKRPAVEKTDRATDPSKPLSSGTADQIVKSVLTGQGKPVEKSAVLLSWNTLPGRPIGQANSAELKQFAAKRGERKAGMVPVMIVIRTGNG
ncbi:anti-sigma factor family protein [Gemmata sp.]|uniref:anti-sigma factor family protein n=1 Tax=Gemmata sp. TaxID=1914242 RepID=UPI003F71F784